MASNQQTTRQRLEDLSIRSRALRSLQIEIQSTIAEISTVYSEYSQLKAQNGALSSSDSSGSFEMEVQEFPNSMEYLEFQLNTKIHFVNVQREKWFKEAKSLQSQIRSEQRFVIEKLNGWKWRQQKFGTSENLREIQFCFECIANLLWDLKLTSDFFQGDVQLLASPGTSYHDTIPALQAETLGLLHELIKNSLIVEEQPPQVIKKKISQFSASVRCLMGPVLGIMTNPPVIKASIVNAEYFQKLCDDPTLQDNNIPACRESGKLVNATAIMEFEEKNQQIKGKFSKMQLQDIARDKVNNSCVTEEKFAFIFQGLIHIADLTFPIFVSFSNCFVTVK